MRIYTHHNVDLDNVCSLWAYLRFALKLQIFEFRMNPLLNDEDTVLYHFRPANWNGEGMEKNDAALDIDVGTKGFKDADGNVSSCFKVVCEEYCTKEELLSLREIIEFVNLHDSKGNALKALNLNHMALKILNQTNLASVFNAIKTYYKHDSQICEAFFPILEGILLNGFQRIEARKQSENCRWIGKVAIVEDQKVPGINKALFAKGALAVVYKEGFDIGVNKNSELLPTFRLDQPFLVNWVNNIEDGWFIHSGGYIIARGTRKAHSPSPSKINPDDLALRVNQLIESFMDPNINLPSSEDDYIDPNDMDHLEDNKEASHAI